LCMSPFQNHRVFWRQFREQFHTTGAILPSGRALGRALARHVEPSGVPKRILEVGPGTGAVTEQIVRRLGGTDHLDLVELNDEFVRLLGDRFAREETFREVAPRTRILHQAVQELSSEREYDLIISGLPLNNFSADDVRLILATFSKLLRSGGTLS